MRLSLTKFSHITIYIYLFVAFPLNFFYALFYVLGVLPKIPFIGYAIFVHIASLPIALFFLSKINLFLNIRYFYLFLFFIVQVFIYTIVGYFLSEYPYNNDAFAQSFLLFYYLIIYTSVGFGVYYFQLVGKKVWLYILYLFLSTVIYLYFRNGSIAFFFHLMNPNAPTINYQEVSAIFLFTWYIYYSGCTSTFDRAKSIIIMLIILTASGARSEFYGSIIALFYVFTLGNIRFNRKKLQAVLLLLIIIAGLAFYTKDFIIDAFESSRQFSVTRLENDGSWQEREYLKQKNLSVIKEHPILGSYASHFDLGRGFYIHNILSAWQQYGLLGFSLYGLIIVMPFIIISYCRVKTDSKKLDGVLFIATFCLIVTFSVKSVYWPYIGLSIGSVMYFYFSNKTMLLRNENEINSKFKSHSINC